MVNKDKGVLMSTLQEQLGMKKPFRILEEEVYLNLKLCNFGLALPLENEFKKFGLTGVTYNILRILRGAGEEGLPCAEISKRMLARVPDVTRLFDRLVRLKYVIRDKKEGDRRVVMQKITEEGLSILSQLDISTFQIHKDNLSFMKIEELTQLNNLLNQIRNHMNDTGLLKV